MKNRCATDNRWRGVGKGGRKGGSVGKNKEVKMDIRVRYTKKAIAGAFLGVVGGEACESDYCPGGLRWRWD